MHKSTFLNKSLILLGLVIITNNVWSYGGGGGYSTTCKPPEFKNMKPAKNISPGGEFSFTASSNTVPGSIKVEAKGHKIDLSMKENFGLQVSGNLPAELVDGYARIKITGSSTPKSCVTEDGWLVKIGG